MFGLANKKEVRKEFDEVRKGFEKRDSEIIKLRDRIETNSLKIATLEGSYLILKEKSQSQGSLRAVRQVPAKSQDSFETKLIQRIRQNKKSMVMAEIIKLLNSHSIIETFGVIVLEKKMCSKASFYRYITSLKSQGARVEIETIGTR